MADLEERQALLAELRDANDARAKTRYDETGTASGGLSNVYVIALLETLLGGPGSPQHVEACVLYEERRAESLDVNEPLAHQAYAQEVAVAEERNRQMRDQRAGPRLVVPGRG